MTDDEIPPTWVEKIDAAQLETHAAIAGRLLPRKPYGCEVPNPKERCWDCAVEIGQLHVPGCCVELCPGCDGQALGCDCDGRGGLLH